MKVIFIFIFFSGVLLASHHPVKQTFNAGHMFATQWTAKDEKGKAVKVLYNSDSDYTKK